MTQAFQVTVLYPSGAPVDMAYYTTQHLPLVARLLTPCGMTDLSYVRPTIDDPTAPFQLIAQLRFSSRKAGLDGLAEHGAATQSDIPNFTDLTPIILMGDLSAFAELDGL